MNVRQPETRRSVATPILPQRTPGYSLRVSRYDRVAALLVALLIIVGASVAMLFTVWLTGRVFVGQAPVTPRLVEMPGDGGMALGAADDFAELGEAEIEELLEPQLSATVDSVTDALSSQLATLESLGAESTASSRGGAAGDSRSPGAGGDGAHVPRWQRWQIMFSANNLDTYARQLDFFGIELGVVGGSDQVDYAAQLSRNPPQSHSGAPREERRMYMTWRFGPLREADLALLKRAGIKTDRRIIMQFIPPEVEDQLANIEMEFLRKNGQSLDEIEKTVFRVVGARGQYQFEVKEVRMLSGRLR